jgi:phenylacetate-CoA ligase
VLSPCRENQTSQCGRVLEDILGRSYDMFINRHGAVVEGGHFMALLYYRDWISKYQVIQRSYSHILFRIVKAGPDPRPAELDEISARSSFIMDDEVEVTFEFVDDIPASDSGKYRFIISEVIT